MSDKPDHYFLDPLKNTKSLKDVTKRTYLKYINTIQNLFWKNNVEVGYIIYNPFEFLEHLHQYAQKTLNQQGKPIGNRSKEAFVSAIISLFSYHQTFKEANPELFKSWVEVRSQVQAPIKHHYLSNEPNEKQKKAYVDFYQIIKIRNQLEPGTYERLLLYMYTEIPPVRVDFYHTKILRYKPNNLPPEQNFIILDDRDPKIILQNYKTSSNYGPIYIDLPSTLVDEIEYSLIKHPREYLFVSSRKGDPYDTKHAFRQWANNILKNIINEEFSLTMFRHIYISRKDLRLYAKSGLEQQKIATIMGHSIAQQQRYSWHTWLNSTPIIDHTTI